MPTARPNPIDHLRLAYYAAYRFWRQHRVHWRLNADDLEDAKQEAMIVLLRACELFDPTRGKPWPAYLCIAIRNRLHHWVRRQPTVELPQQAPGRIVRQVEMPALATSWEPALGIFLQELVAAIDRLPADQRDVIRRRYGIGCEEQTVPELATERQCSRQAVYARQRAGELRLKKILDR